jgi:hypothetical protein
MVSMSIEVCLRLLFLKFTYVAAIVITYHVQKLFWYNC